MSYLPERRRPPVTLTVASICGYRETLFADPGGTYGFPRSIYALYDLEAMKT